MILTNNSILRHDPNIIWVEGDQGDVLKHARDLIHQGYRLLTSPLAASGRMHFSPVRSLILSDEPEETGTRSALTIENGIALYQTMISRHSVDHRNKADYEFIDNELLTQALYEINELSARYELSGGKQVETGKTQS